MKRFFTYLVFCAYSFSTNYCFAQQKKDSIILLLKTAKEDTNKLNLLYQLSYDSDNDKDVLFYSNKMLLLAQKLNIKKRIADARINFGVVYEKQGLSAKALESFNEGLKNYEEINDKVGIATVYNNLGLFYKTQGNIKQALQYYNKSLFISTEIGNKNNISSALNNIGIIYKYQGNIAKALECYYKSLKNYEELGDKVSIATLMGNIGLIYRDQGDILKAMEYFNKSLKIQLEIGDKTGIGSSYNNIGRIYKNEGNFEGALNSYLKSLKIREEIGDRHGTATTLNNLGSLYQNQAVLSKKTKELNENISQSMTYYEKGLFIQEEIGDKEGMSRTLSNMGAIFLKQKNYKKAENYCLRALQLAKEFGFPVLIAGVSKTLVKIYKEMGSSALYPLKEKVEYLTQACAMNELFKLMSDSINNLETRKSGLKKQMQYDFEKKESETKAEQDKKDIIANEELQKQKVVRNSFIAGFVLVLILGLVVLRSYRQKQKANHEINSQKNIIEAKQKEILDSIRYAKRIQTALMASEKYIEKNLNKLNV